MNSNLGAKFEHAAGPISWRSWKLRDLVRLQSGFPFNSEEFEEAGNVPLVRIRDLHSNTYKTYISGSVPPGSMIANGDVIVGMDGDFSVVQWKRGPAALNQRLCALRPRTGVDARFIRYCLPGVLRSISQQTSATTVKHLSANDLLSQVIDVPPLDDQRKIAEYLDEEIGRIDQAITARRSQRKLVEESRASALENTICGKSLRGDRKQWPHGTIPHTWDVVPLRRLVTEIRVGVVVNPSNYFCDEGLPFVHGYNVRNGLFDLSNLKFISEKDSRVLSRTRLRTGDVLVVRAGEPGRSAVVPSDLEGGNCASVLVIRSVPEVRPEWLSTFFNSPQGRAQVGASQYGAAQEVTSVAEVRRLNVPFCSLIDQDVLLGDRDRHLTDLNRLDSVLARQGKVLAEKREVLITAAVKGHIDVSTARGDDV